MVKWILYGGIVCISTLWGSTLETRLQKAGLAYRAAETSMSRLEDDIRASEAQLLEKAEAFSTTTQKMGRLLVALRTLKTALPSHILTATHSAQDVLHQTTMMNAYVRGLYQQVNQLKKDIADLEQAKQKLHQKKDTLNQSVHQHKTAYEKLETLVAVQKKEAQQKKEADEAQKKAITKAKNLKELIRKLEKNTPIPEAGVKATGLLPPVQGPLVVGYGKTDPKSPDGKGIVMRARAKAFVLAPTTGTILFAGPFRTYQNIIILGFNKQYTVLLTGLHHLSVKTGQSVKVGDPIGQTHPDNKAYIYLEMRKNSTPMKPEIVGLT